LKEFLPPGFELMGEPVVTVFETYIKEIDWLAGRGYNVLGVNFQWSIKVKRTALRGPS